MTLMVPDTIQAQVEKAGALIRQILGRDLLAIHLYGSAVEGGLKPYSDIDLLVTTSQSLTAEQRKTLLENLLSVSAWPGTSERYRALEVTVIVHADVTPWHFPPQREMQFGEWLREEIGAGVYESAQQDCDLAILLTHVLNASIPVFGERAGVLFEPVPKSDILHTFSQTLDLWQSNSDLQGDERNIILTLARIWYSVETGNFAAKDKAAEWLIPRLPAEHASILQVARLDYLGLANVDWQSAMPAVACFVWYVKAKIGERLQVPG